MLFAVELVTRLIKDYCYVLATDIVEIFTTFFMQDRFLKWLRNYGDWVKENNLNEIIDMNDPINKNFLSPTLGYLTSDCRYNHVELITLFDNNDITDYFFS